MCNMAFPPSFVLTVSIVISLGKAGSYNGQGIMASHGDILGHFYTYSGVVLGKVHVN